MTIKSYSKSMNSALAEHLNQNPELELGVVKALAVREAADVVRRIRHYAISDDGEQGITQAKLAEKLGVRQPRISQIEKADLPEGPSYAMVRSIAAVCNVDWQDPIVAAAEEMAELPQDEITFEEIAQMQSEQAALVEAPYDHKPLVFKEDFEVVVEGGTSEAVIQETRSMDIEVDMIESLHNVDEPLLHEDFPSASVLFSSSVDAIGDRPSDALGYFVLYCKNAKSPEGAKISDEIMRLHSDLFSREGKSANELSTVLKRYISASIAEGQHDRFEFVVDLFQHLILDAESSRMQLNRRKMADSFAGWGTHRRGMARSK